MRLRISVRSWSVRPSVRKSVPGYFRRTKIIVFVGRKSLNEIIGSWYNDRRWRSRIWCTPAVLVPFLEIKIAREDVSLFRNLHLAIIRAKERRPGRENGNRSTGRFCFVKWRLPEVKPVQGGRQSDGLRSRTKKPLRETRQWNQAREAGCDWRN